MTEQLKARPFALVLLAFFVGIAVGFGASRWENSVAQKAAGLLNEMKVAEAMSEEWDQLNRYWNSNPEIAQALLERELRAHERLLPTTEDAGKRRVLLTKEVLLKDMVQMHVRLASLCRKKNQPDCVSEHVAEAMRLGNASSNEVWTAIAKLEEKQKTHTHTPNE